ncbi:zinc ribbon domain-containing protein [Halobaculum roseum]|uniref:zinc ribbon domain-containing protein n=1 Tax=Halobaculum roseum TaxID=2175149 RepID=UPI00338A685B
MGSSNPDPTPPEDLSDSLLQRIDELELRELKSLCSYIQQRIDELQPLTEEEIKEDTSGKVLDVERHGAYTVVRMHPPDPDGGGVNTEFTSLYHVSREERPDGTDSLHWAYLGDVHNTAQTRCETCGRTLDDDGDGCPHCGSDDVDRSDTEE